MLLSLLTKEEKYYFIDLLNDLISVDGDPTQIEANLIKKLKLEMGEDISKYKKSNLSKEKLMEYFSSKPKATKNLVFLNLVSVSLNDEWYSVEEHFLLEEIQQAFDISDKKKIELMKVVYAERDLRERIKRVISD